MPLSNKLALVTGCSKGIGLATVKLLLDNGALVAGWGRTAPKVDHPNFKFFKVDVGNIASVEEGWKALQKTYDLPVHYLINNAGLGYEALFEELEVEKWDEMFRTNVHGIFYVSRKVIPGMKAMEDGYIINISSIAGTTGIEGMSGYCGTKFAVKGISQSMYKELRKSGIKVTCIYPGSVNTAFFDNIASVTANTSMMRAEDVAETIIYCLKTSPNYHPVDIEVRPLRPKR
jgi:NADP-dependent 3-hydroxy acid dehydrogenase YdfG